MNDRTVDAETLRAEELRLRYVELVRRPDVFPTRANWRYIASHAMHGLARALYGKYLAAIVIDDNDRDELHDVAVEEFPAYLAAIDRREAVDAVYSDLHTARGHSLALIRDHGLFDAHALLNLMEAGDTGAVFEIIDVYQPEYTSGDLAAMQRLLDALAVLPELGHIEPRKSIFGSALRYICPAGHVNDSGDEFCRHPGCGLDICGLTAPQREALEIYRHRVEALRSLMDA